MITLKCLEKVNGTKYETGSGKEKRKNHAESYSLVAARAELTSICGYGIFAPVKIEHEGNAINFTRF